VEPSSNVRTTQSVALLVAALSSFLTPFMSAAMNVALRDVGSEFSMSAVLLGCELGYLT